MQIDLGAQLLSLADMPAGTFFITQSAEEPIWGMSAFQSHEKAAVLFSTSPGTSPYPCVVSERYMGNALLTALPDAYFRPSLTRESLQPHYVSPSGPGSIFLAVGAPYMRVARGNEGYRYVNLASGEIQSNPPEGGVLHVNEWSVHQLSRGGAEIELFTFEGPKEFK